MPRGRSIATVAQFLFIVAVIATGNVNRELLIAASVLSAAAAIDYVVRFR